MPWAVAFLCSSATGGLFALAWAFVQSGWVRKNTGSRKPIIAAILSISLIGLALASLRPAAGELIWLLPFGLWMFLLIVAFAMRGALEKHFNTAEPMNLWLRGSLTLLFTTFYVQHQLRKISLWRKAMTLRP